jgi:DNA invertase Pin-like site-specific DNA recombinase
MHSSPPILAAQYLRMSTERQEYSIDNQAAAIYRNAETHGYVIVQTYEDAGKSGLTIGHRNGLKALLSDILRGKATYHAVLVYDVSRWGRFQDADEAAHYEFLCKTSGTRVHYCAEEFGIDDTLPSRMMKALKRTMAAEFSRELSERVFAGKKRLAELGFHEGGPPGYGLKRVLVSADGQVKQELRRGELKSITTDHVLLEPGPRREQQWVRWIYAQFIRGLDMTDIAKELNLRSVPWIEGKRWNRYAVRQILTNRKYAGWNVWAVWTQKLRTRYRRNPPDRWVLKEAAFEGVVDQSTFDRAQRVIASKTYRKSNDALLRDVKRLLKRHGGVISESLIDCSPRVPSCSTLRHRFGSMRKVYELIGFKPAHVHGVRTAKSRMMAKLRFEVLESIQRQFPKDAVLVRRNYRCRYVVEFPEVGQVGLILCRSSEKLRGVRCWELFVRQGDRDRPALVCLLSRENDGIEAFYVVPNIDALAKLTLTPEDPWFQRGMRLESLAGLRSVLGEIQEWVPLGPVYRGISNAMTQLMGVPGRNRVHDGEHQEARARGVDSSTHQASKRSPL